MSLAFSKAGRKADLAQTKVVPLKKHYRPAPESRGPVAPRPYRVAEAIANEAVGNKRFEVVAVTSKYAALSMNPEGPKSVEYAPAYAVPTGGDRVRFDTKAIGKETARINKQAKKDAIIAALNERDRLAMEAQWNEIMQRQRHRREMGDFANDERFYDDEAAAEAAMEMEYLR